MGLLDHIVYTMGYIRPLIFLLYMRNFSLVCFYVIRFESVGETVEHVNIDLVMPMKCKLQSTHHFSLMRAHTLQLVSVTGIVPVFTSLLWSHIIGPIPRQFSLWVHITIITLLFRHYILCVIAISCIFATSSSICILSLNIVLSYLLCIRNNLCHFLW